MAILVLALVWSVLVLGIFALETFVLDILVFAILVIAIFNGHFGFWFSVWFKYWFWFTCFWDPDLTFCGCLCVRACVPVNMLDNAESKLSSWLFTLTIFKVFLHLMINI